MTNYILDGHTAVAEPDTLKWARWYESHRDRHVGNDKFDGLHVSTVFLSIDHRFGAGPPILFETMIFGGEHDEFQCRYETWEQAESGHKAIVARLKAGLPPEESEGTR